MTILWVAHEQGPNASPTTFEGLGESLGPAQTFSTTHDVGEARAALKRGDVGVVILALQSVGDALSALLPGSPERAAGEAPFVILCPPLSKEEEASLWQRGAFEVLQGEPLRPTSVCATVRRALHFGRETRAFRRERAHLTSVIGHDLKNPLSAVLMTAHVLQNRVADKDKPALDRIRRASQRMDRMIQDVVDFLHLRQGTALLLRFDGCDLGRLCRNAIDELARVQPGHQVVFENERPLPGTWDGERLEQLVFHVLSHGLMSGLAADGASLKLGSDVASEVTVTMHCRGRALSATEAAGLFDPLALEPGHVAASSSMGLYIARAIARAHGGDLMIAGPAEGGTEMTLRLPRTDLPASLAPG